MTLSRADTLLRKPGQPERATFLELFFDLAFILALTRVSQRLVEDVSAETRIVLSTAGQTLLVLLAIWMVWFVTALITDLYDPDQPQLQLLVVATMFGSLLMAVAVPRAFGSRGLLFAGAYVAVHLGRGLFLVPALRGHPAQRRAARVLFWFGVSALAWIAGALVPGVATRGILWTVAIAVDFAAQVFRLPAPWLGRPPAWEMPVVAEHLSERYRQFFIIALGELILVAGITFSGTDLKPSQTVAFGISFATTVLLWRIYIHRAGEQLPDAIAISRFPGRLALWLSLAHLVMVIGIVGASAGFALVITHPFGRTDPPWPAVILGGPALFLIGRTALGYGVYRRISLFRLAGAVVLLGLAPALVHTPTQVIATAATLVLLMIAVLDAALIRTHPAQPSPPQ